MSGKDPGFWFVRFREQGDGDALATVFDRTAPVLLSIAAHLTGRVQDAEDLVQATFVTAIEKARRYDARRPLLPWLAGILARHARNAARKRSGGEVPADLDVAAPDPVLERLVDAEERRAFLQAVEGLPSPYREVVQLRMRTGQSGREIGAELRRAPGTVRIQLHRGLQLLRKALPPGLLAGAGLAVLPERGLAAIRAEVLRHGAAASIAGSTATVTVMGVAMSKAMLAIPAVVVVGVAGWFLSTSFLGDERQDSTDRVQASPSIMTVAEEPPADEEPATAPPSLEVSREEAGRLNAPTAPATAPAPGTVRVTGRVLEERGRRPVAGAAVWVSVGELIDWAPPEDHTRTAPDGTFEFHFPYRLAQQVQVWTEEYAFLSERVRKPGQVVAEREGIDVGDLVLTEGTLLRGQVVTHDGRPVPDATVLLHRQEAVPSFYPAHSRPLGRTGPDGRFALAHVPASLFRESRLYAVAAAGIGARALEIPEGVPEITDVEIRLDAPAELWIHVVDPEQRPIPDAMVFAMPFHFPYVHRGIDVDQGAHLWLSQKPELLQLFMAESDEAGVAMFPSVPAGRRVMLNAYAEGYVHEHHPLSLEKGPGQDHTVVLNPDGVRRILGQVVALDGRPLGGVHVQRYRWYQSTWSPSEEEVEADDRGQFEFPSVPAGSKWHLVVNAPDIAKVPLLVEVPATGDLTGVELVAQTAHVVTGIVRDEDGNTVPGAHAYLQRDGDEIVRVHPTSMETGDDGAFELVNATAGPWTLVVLMPEPRGRWRHGVLSIPIQADVGHVDVVAEFDPGGHALLEVEVVSMDTGAPLRPSRAWYYHFERHTQGHHATFPLECEEGWARHESARAGDAVVRVEVPDHAPAEARVTIQPSDTRVHVRVEVGQLASIRGRVVLGDLASSSPWWVFADQDCLSLEPSGAPQTSVTRRCAKLEDTDVFHLVEVPPGPLELTLMGAGISGVVRVDVQSGQEHRVDLHARPAGVVQLRGTARHSLRHLQLYLWYGEDEPKQFILSWPGQEKPEDQAFDWPRGRFRYELRHGVGQAGVPDRKELEVLAEGEVVVTGGEAAAIDIPPP